ncbi:MAG: TIGR01212 family radical SAM protein [Lachnospiraceae bacterium]|nr:TIGR01212 family radical SAM protein [Lachnospiraceae bacterium]
MRKYWNEKRYYSLDYYLKETFGEKVYRIALNGGMTCPNRDGTLDTRGCIFCSAGGSGDFASSVDLSVTKQIEEGKKLLQKKTDCRLFIAYFQAYTNTYAPVSYLRKIFSEAICHPDIVALSIATRTVCLDSEILTLLSELNHIKPVWVELGLQTIHPQTAAFIRRGFDYDCYEKAVFSLKAQGISVITHLILGLPSETHEQMLSSVKKISTLPLDGVKLQLLHVLENTDLADYYKKEGFSVLSQEEYVELIIDCLEYLPQNVVIHRLTGDGPRKLLLAPEWSIHKKQVLNQIQRRLKERDTYQGRLSEL